jgi:HD-like signal output (HDOD) protein
MIQSLTPGKTLSESEHEHFGFDHGQLGERIAELWKFPQAAQAAIAHHHASNGCRGEHTAVVRCVEVANLICTLKGMSSVGLNLLRSSRAVLDAMSLSKEDVEVLASDLDHELELHSNLFTL